MSAGIVHIALSPSDANRLASLCFEEDRAAMSPCGADMEQHQADRRIVARRLLDTITAALGRTLALDAARKALGGQGAGVGSLPSRAPDGGPSARLAEAEAKAERLEEALVYIARCAGCGTDYCVDGEVCHGYQRMTREQLVDTCVEDSRRAKAALLPPADGGGGE